MVLAPDPTAQIETSKPQWGDDLQAGITYRLRPDRPNNPHQFAVWDGSSNSKRYRRRSFADRAKGLAWAKGERRAMDAGEATAIRPLLSEIGPAYIKRLRSKMCAPCYITQVEKVIAQMRARHMNDMAAEDFPDQVQRWLDGMRGRRRQGTEPGPAAPASKRRTLTIARCLCHLAQKMPGRPLRYDPLAIVVVPRQDRHDKPVFSVPELRLLLSDECRFPQRRVRRDLELAIAQADGNREAAAKILNVHVATVYNRLNAVDIEDPQWLVLALGIYTGARPGEIQAMRWEWLSLHEDALILPADAPGNKTRLARIVPLQPELRAILVERMRVGIAGPMLPPEVVKLNQTDRAARFRNFIHRCGIEPAGRGPHSLRHNCGALLTAMSLHPVQVLLWLGHENPKVSHGYVRTATRYRHDIRGWGDRFYLRDQPPAVPAGPALPMPKGISHVR